MTSLPIRRVEFVTIYTKDLHASRKFYVDLLGFPLLREVGGEFFQIDIAGVPVCVDLATEGTRRANNIGIEVDNLDVAVTILRNKGLEVHLGFNSASQEQWAAVQDLDGNELIFLVHAGK